MFKYCEKVVYTTRISVFWGGGLYTQTTRTITNTLLVKFFVHVLSAGSKQLFSFFKHLKEQPFIGSLVFFYTQSTLPTTINKQIKYLFI